MAALALPSISHRSRSFESDRTLAGGGGSPTCEHALTDESCNLHRHSSSPFYASSSPNRSGVADGGTSSPEHETLAPGRELAELAHNILDLEPSDDSDLLEGLLEDSPQVLLAQRYDKRPRVSRRNEQVESIKHCTKSFNSGGLSSRGNWVHVEHPEGQPYFIKKTETGAHLYTDMWLYDDQKLENAEKYSQRISQALGAQDHTDTDVVIDIRRDSEDDTGIRCFYYLASRSQRSIFWLRDVPVDLISQNARPVYDERYLSWVNGHVSPNVLTCASYDRKCLACAILVQFNLRFRTSISGQHLTVTRSIRIHIQMFPNDRTVSEQLLREVRQLVNYAAFDSQTSKSSTSPYGPDDLSNLSKVLKVVQKEINIVDESSMFILARTLSIFYWERFIHFHGQPEARLDREQPVFEDTEHQRSWLLALVSPLLFYLPDQYMGELKKLWVEQTVNYRPWMAFVAGLRNDWESSILPATVLLSANVGLLAVNSIDSEHRNRSVAQVASYISTFFSLGNIILCTIFARQHRPRAHDSAELASDYLDRRSTVIAGLEPLAIAFSLPSALFIWGMVAFTVAMAWVGLNASTVQTRVWTGLFLGVITVLIAAVLWVEVWPVPSLEWLSRYVPPPPWHTIRLPRFRLSARSSQPLGDQGDVELQARSFE